MIEKLDVFLWEEKVGTLVQIPKGYKTEICFFYDNLFIQGNRDISPLRASIKGKAAQRGLPVYPEDNKIFGGLPSFIADSLPDHWGNTVFAEWAKRNGLKSKHLSPLDRLAYIGKRGMGAFEFVPSIDSRMEKSFEVQIDSLAELARHTLMQANRFSADINPSIEIQNLFSIGTSAGGRRPKAVININLETMNCLSGQVPIPSMEYIPMIIKFYEHSDIPTTNIEYSYYLMAKDAGMTMMDSILLEGKAGAHFLTRRFDRDGSKKLFTQTLAALSPNSRSYEDLFEVIERLRLPANARKQAFIMMVMNILGGNIDDHNKNFSFIMDDNGLWDIAPAYDYTFSVDPDAPSYTNRHSLSINGKIDGIVLEDILEVANQFGVKAPRTIVTKAEQVLRNYRSYAKAAGVNEKWENIIATELNGRIDSILQ